MPFCIVREEKLRLRHPWPLGSAGSLSSRSVGYVEALDEAGNVVAVGEAAPSLGSGETIHEAIAWLRSNVGSLSIEDHAGLMASLDGRPDAPQAARAAFEMAALDWQSRQAGKPLYGFLGLPAPDGAVCAPVIASATEAVLAAELEAAAGAEAIVLKVGYGSAARDVETAQLARIKTDAALRIDASGGWTPDEALGVIQRINPLGVEYITQPLAQGRIEETAALREQSPVAIFLDQDVACVEDVDRVASACDGVRISPMRVGGISRTLQAVVRARELGLLVAIGADLESPVAAAAVGHLARLADYCDTASERRFEAPTYQGFAVVDGRLAFSQGAGLGVWRPAIGAM